MKKVRVLVLTGFNDLVSKLKLGNKRVLAEINGVSFFVMAGHSAMGVI